MIEPTILIVETTREKALKKLPSFCRKNQLGFEFAIHLPRGEQWVDLSFSLIKRLLKLFPFENMRIEVEAGRVKDVFSDWDSYLEWFQTESFREERLFRRIEVGRFSKGLGYFDWENQADPNHTLLKIYTQSDQNAPFEETSRKVAEEKAIEFSQKSNLEVPALRLGFKLFKLFR